jgi:hypothetical protein
MHARDLLSMQGKTTALRTDYHLQRVHELVNVLLVYMC